MSRKIVDLTLSHEYIFVVFYGVYAENLDESKLKDECILCFDIILISNSSIIFHYNYITMQIIIYEKTIRK